MLTLAFDIQPVKAGGTIFIGADGSIDPPTAPIYTADNITYTLSGNISSDTDGIVVERNNIILDGADYTVAGSGSGNGTTLAGRSNATVRNMTIKDFFNGIFLDFSSNNTLSGNNVRANNLNGICLESSSSNILSDNNVTANGGGGISLDHSSNNMIFENSLANIG